MRQPLAKPVVVRKATIFHTGPWREQDGDPSRPEQVNGVPVIDQIRTRRDEPGAVVMLQDGRFAYTGRFTAVGSPRDLRRAAERRLRLSQSDGEQAWWREVIGAIALGS